MFEDGQDRCCAEDQIMKDAVAVLPAPSVAPQVTVVAEGAFVRRRCAVNEITPRFAPGRVGHDGGRLARVRRKEDVRWDRQGGWDVVEDDNGLGA
jgi:hypothetical protein